VHTSGWIEELVPTLAPDRNRAHDIDDVTDRLVRRFGTSSGDAFRVRVCRQFENLNDVTIRQFVPVFVERRVRAELQRSANFRGSSESAERDGSE
jgi:hypothetical protein